MYVTLKNIGVIADSTIEISGLTIITGHNNSGKTTLGKTMYGLVSAVEDLEGHALADKSSYAINQMRRILNRLGGWDELSDEMLEKYPYISMFLEKPWDVGNTLAELYEVIQYVVEEVETLSLDDLQEINTWEVQDEELNLEERYTTLLDEKEEALKNLKQMEGILKADPELIDYATARISKNLLMEFNQQILPILQPQSSGEIVVRDAKGQRYYYKLKIKDNNIVTSERTYFSSAYESVIFLDDVYVLDSVSERYRVPKFRRILSNLQSEQDFSDNILGQDHNQHLLSKLRGRQGNLFEELVYAHNAKTILEKIDKAFPDTVAVVNGKYVCAESKLDVRNLATGSKMFAIIKMLLERGEMNNHTLLILDEPEAHLHPEWQSYFAEVVVLLVQLANVDVLLTTHSPNFLLAMEMHSKKYKVWGRTNIYDTERIEESSLVRYKNVKEEMHSVYSKLAEPLFAIQKKLQELEE